MTSMRDLIDKLNEIESKPSVGDGFFLELGENVEIETEILEITEDGDIIVAGDDKVITILEDLKKFERQQINEVAPLAVLALLAGGGSIVGGSLSNYFLGNIFGGGGANPAGEFSDRSLKSQAYNLARAKGHDDQTARDFADDVVTKGPNSPEAKEVLNQTQNLELQARQELAAKTDDYVADKSEAEKLAAQGPFKDTKDAFAKIQATVQDNLPTDTIAKMAQYAKQYALPGAAIVAILYGGKKLYDYLASDSKAVAEKISLPTVNYQGGDGMSSIFTKTTNNPFNQGTETLVDKLKQTIGGASQTINQKTTIKDLGNNTQSIDTVRSMSTAKENAEQYDKTSGGPYDRGSADAYYGRPPRPHKMAPVVGGVQGQMERVPLTDPKEIAAYNAGYSEEDDRKDYGESFNEEDSSTLKNYNVYKQTKDLTILINKNKNYAAVANKNGKVKWHGELASDGGWEFTQVRSTSPRYGVFYVNSLDDILDMDPYELVEAQDFQLDEAKYQGRSVPLGKPMRGDVKKFKVYVRNPATGNIKKVNFGDKKMRIKKSNPKRRKSFRARHNCANPGPRTKARYWSCRKW